MPQPYTPLIEIDGRAYFPEPYSVQTLPNTLKWGLVPIGLLATLSVASTIALICFIVSRFITWRQHYRTFVGYNQYVVLVLNLLLADLQQSASFLISWHWFHKNHILAPSPACFAQGWLLHSGDVASGFFVLAIAIHTWYTAVYGRRVGNKAFAGLVVGIWIFVYFLTVIGVGIHGHQKYFTAAGAWCWVSPAYEVDRLWCHYIWIFIVEFGTILIYFLTFFSLRKRTASLLVDGQIPPDSPNAHTIKAVNRITMMMTLYPCVYVLLTLPLSAGRMWSMSNGSKPTSDLFACIAGSLLTSCGWVDSLLYTLTRKRLLQDTMPNSSSRRTGGEWENTLGSKGITHTRTVTVEAGALVDFEMMSPEERRRRNIPSMAFGERSPSPSGSIDPILSGKGLGAGGMQSGVKTEITVGHREVPEDSSEEQRHELEAIPPAYHQRDPRRSSRRKFSDDSD